MDPQPGVRRVDSVYSESLDGISIRLLRFSQPEDGVFVGRLQTFRLATAPRFFTASYVWGQNTPSDTFINLDDGPLPVLNSLVPFLNMVTNHAHFDENQWWWIDSLCINLADGHEREEQVRIMAQIYRKSKRAVVWLGEVVEKGSDCTGAIDFLHHLRTLLPFGSNEPAFSEIGQVQRLLHDLPDLKAKSDAIISLFSRPWWTRVWTLQEYVLPKHAKLYCGSQGISRGKLKSAIYSIFLCCTLGSDYDHQLVPRKIFDGAFNRRRIHQWHNKHESHGMGLVSILAYLGNHSASDPRDRIYSVLGLVSARDRALVGSPEYQSSTELLYARLVRSFWAEYESLDIICFVNQFSRYTGPTDPGPEHAVPLFVPDWRTMVDFASPVPLMASQSASEHIGNFRPLRSTVWKANFDAPGPRLSKKANVSFSDDLQTMWCDGVILDVIHGLGAIDSRELRCQSFICAVEGHHMMQPEKGQDADFPANIAPRKLLETIGRSIVLDRQDKYLCFHTPTEYMTDFLHLCHACIANDPVDWSFQTWFELNKNLRFGEQTLEELVSKIPSEPPSSPPPLLRPSTHPHYQGKERLDPNVDNIDNFLSRFHDTVRKKARRLVVTKEGLVGMAPCRAREGDGFAILFGCSIPLVLRNRTDLGGWEVIGEGYIHGFMNGEVADLIRRGKKTGQRFQLI